MRSLFCDVTQRLLVVTDVTVQPLGPIIETGSIGCPETPVTTIKRCVTSQETENRIYTATACQLMSVEP
jgi:hypothetical protein